MFTVSWHSECGQILRRASWFGQCKKNRISSNRELFLILQHFSLCVKNLCCLDEWHLRLCFSQEWNPSSTAAVFGSDISPSKLSSWCSGQLIFVVHNFVANHKVAESSRATEEIKQPCNEKRHNVSGRLTTSLTSTLWLIKHYFMHNLVHGENNLARGA